MNCTELTAKEILNYCYGEISSETEEAVESHLSECEACRTELARHRKFLELFDDRGAVVDAGLLVQCRTDLSRALREQVAAEGAHMPVWAGASFKCDGAPARPFACEYSVSRAGGVTALVALGFVARDTRRRRPGGVRAALAEPMFSACGRWIRVPLRATGADFGG